MMSIQGCAACNTAPAQLYCSADNAFLCTACDVVVHSANKLAQRHARVPLTVFHDGTVNPDPELRPTTSCFDGYETNGTDKTQPAETYLEDSDESQETLLVPSGSYRECRSRPPTDTNAARRYVPTLTAELAWPPPQTPRHSNDCAGEQDHQRLLETMAEAFIHKEAQNLLQSSCSLDVDYTSSDRTGPICFSARTEALLRRGAAKHGRRSAMRSTSRSHSHVAAASEATSHSGHGDQGRQTQSGVLSESSPSGGDHILRENSGADAQNIGAHSLAKEVTAEQKRRDRHAALRKFRAKKANRSFQKKVRYACRKQLADSRPREKGRFVGRVKPAIITNVAHARGAGPTV